MRRIVLLCLTAILACTGAHAQALQVASFEALEHDLAAMTGPNAMEDQNGEPAALVKIQTPDVQNITFDGGALGVVSTKYVGNEIWMYLPARAQRLSISHPTFGMMRNYYYPVAIEGGKTYRMVLDIGVGRYVSIIPSMDVPYIEIDGKPTATATLRNQYMLYGKHVIKAVSNRYEAADTIFLSSHQPLEQTIKLNLREMNELYGQVHVSVPDDVSIWFDGDSVGSGQWQSSLRKGSYELETRRDGCEPSKTFFTVKPQQDNEIEVNLPVPYHGWLKVITRPSDVKMQLSNGYAIAPDSLVPLPVDEYKLKLSQKKYVGQTRNYYVGYNETVTDTVTLRPNTRVFGLTVSHEWLNGYSAPGLAFSWGRYNWHYVVGVSLALTDPSTFFCFNVMVERKFHLTEHFTIAPYIGYRSYVVGNDKEIEGFDYRSIEEADGDFINMIPVGLRLRYAMSPNFALTASCDYNISIDNKASYDYLTLPYGVDFKGFNFGIGLEVSFGRQSITSPKKLARMRGKVYQTKTGHIKQIN